MDRSIPLLLIGLVFGGGIGFTIAAAGGITLDGHDHGNPAHHAGTQGAGHDHSETLDAPDGTALTLSASRDPDSGWNLHIATDGFSFAPERASGDHVPGEGHAHVYVDGVKIARVYSPWVHLDASEGARVTVTLNANDHRVLAADGEALSESVTLGAGS
ncbi:hypothetical protein [Roseivivax sediminis]|uniref:Uncharacterized protein n=1 Tax=Roseivivax sediminis TaxID=936889 RepID=A0A1I1U193_9RHOB|nr:hypothetical protein [Roseivivax sediminis]SFD64435.1 hypothetical protein SAMN04515678_10287 [Roseivivax sediminis]